MLYILLGQDDFSLRQLLGKIKRSIGDQSLLAANTTTLDGQQATLDQLRTVCETPPFLAEKRLVIVEGLLERFELKSKSSRQRKITHLPNQQDECKALGLYISQIPDSTILVLIDSRISRNNPLFRELSAKAEVRPFPLLKDTRLCQWIERRVAGEGGSISPQAVNLLAKLVGSNLWIMANEINKLVLLASGRRIEEEDVTRIVSFAQEANVFTMVDAILAFKAGVAEQLLEQLLQAGAAPAYLLFMISRQVHMIVRAKELRNQGKSEIEIKNRIGLTSDFALHKTLEQANKYPVERLKDVYNKILQADLAIKTGKYDGELALNILIAELCQKRQM